MITQKKKDNSKKEHIFLIPPRQIYGYKYGCNIITKDGLKINGSDTHPLIR